MTRSSRRSRRITPQRLTDDPEDWDRYKAKAEQELAFVDKRSAAMRALIYEYGYDIVLGMWLDGHRDAAKLRTELEAWRERKQAQWLSAIPYRRVHSVNTQP